ncbi:MAG: 2-oxoglutarate dehydrogenase complex dihydrolipoyllysine-residue succinyltransferase [Janthinobacterium lividum]
MSHQLVVPALGESVSEATVARWLKKVGDMVKMDDPLIELETDKVTLEVNAPQAGILEQITADQGTIVQVGQALGSIGEGQAQNQGPSPAAEQVQNSQQNQGPVQQAEVSNPLSNQGPSQATPAISGSFSYGPAAPQNAANTPSYVPSPPTYTAYGPPQPANAPSSNAYYQPAPPPQHTSMLQETPSQVSYQASTPEDSQKAPILSPAARKMAAENQISPQDIQGSGRAGRVTKQDVQHYVQHPEHSSTPSSPQPQPENQVSQPQGQPPAPVPSVPQVTSMPSRQIQMTQVAQPEERVRMTRLRQRIAERLKEAQNTAAMLTTFNEIDMSHVMATRESYREKFEKRFGIKLGFMSFFVKAAVSALKEIPSVNAEIEDDYIVYKNHYDIGVAVSAPQGLVVPVVRDADHLNFAEIENSISQLSEKARTGKLSMSDLSGGTFTITNGGVFGSLMSTPILNPPQSGILGMHKIQKRPVAIDDRVEIRPMMYVALTYDHRIIDGREAVTFLVRIKENIEDPQRILLGI